MPETTPAIANMLPCAEACRIVVKSDHPSDAGRTGPHSVQVADCERRIRQPDDDEAHDRDTGQRHRLRIAEQRLADVVLESVEVERQSSGAIDQHAFR
jgi:hypothetical protein